MEQAAGEKKYILREMAVGDIDQVSEIERRSFTMPWSPLTYVYEIRQNPDSYMGVIELPDQPARPLIGAALERFQILLRPFKVNKSSNYSIVAYGGMWFKGGEAHISTIAAHPDYRGHKLGELMLLGLISQGLALDADQIVLEVRVTNEVAQKLYVKYGFRVVEVIPQYYYDNREDAYLMAVKPVDMSYRQMVKKHLDALYQQVYFRDTFTPFRLEQVANQASNNAFLNPME